MSSMTVLNVVTLLFGFVCYVNCNLTCFACSNSVIAAECSSVQRCAQHEVCFMDMYLTSDGRLTFEMGCRDTALCGSARRQRTSSYLQCTQCCDANLCNNALCRQPGLQDLGPICYACEQELSADSCSSVKQCGRDQVCQLERYTSPSVHSSVYRTMCAEMQDCSRQLEVMRTLFGKRYQEEVISDTDSALVMKCCDDNVCNDGHTAPVTGGDYCSRSPCVHGTCFEGDGGFVCQCDSGYQGTTCDQAVVQNHCSSNPCVFGTCFDGATGFACLCDSQHQGTLCDQAVSFCSSNPCVHGTCFDGATSFACLCESGYQGTLCDKSSLCKRDIVFLLDTSASIGETDIAKSVQFVQEIIVELDVGQNQIHTALVTYGAHPEVLWEFGTYTTRSQIIQALGSVGSNGGTSNAVKALNTVNNEVFTETRGDRPDVGNVLVLFSDGEFTDVQGVIAEARLLQGVCDDIFTFALESAVNSSDSAIDNFELIATDSEHVIGARSLTSLANIMTDFIQNICD